ncbi:conserved protein of unknown function [Sterolibacterium denitrificans]|uniref:Uncharacterized protein n=1 Tax=Sterolibacterium denitrificans TaxID=157592 RepID=A0A7Z7HR38_9PROT|nr:hypothetical protein [Sterolibacterium denitrificans]SMB24967.1 conserved protein of unknown function [Sterolibacterium denitrificans]
MKRAKRDRRSALKPRNPYVAPALQRKAGAHQRKDKRAERARQHSRLRRELSEDR